MKGGARSLALFAAAVGVIVFAALRIFPGAPRERLVDLYILFLGALVTLTFVRATRAAGSAGVASLFDRALRRPRPEAARPPGLAKLEREVALAASSAFDLHFRLRPTLREIAAHRLALRGLDLDRGSGDTRALLGAELWELVRPDRPQPADRFAPGVPLPRVRAMLDTLDKI